MLGLKTKVEEIEQSILPVVQRRDTFHLLSSPGLLPSSGTAIQVRHVARASSRLLEYRY